MYLQRFNVRISLPIAAIALLGLCSPARAIEPTEQPSVGAPPGCERIFTRAQYAGYARSVYRRERVSRTARARLRELVYCQHSPRARAQLRRLRTDLIGARRDRRWAAGHPWLARWRALSAADRAWARSTGSCESGNNPTTNTGNGFYGSMQWLPSTWRAAGGRGMPHHASLHEQWVRAVWWRNRTSWRQWPVCGR